MAEFSIVVTGDWGTDTYTHYIPGYVSEGHENFHPEVAFDLAVPSGAGLHQIALESLLPPRDIKVSLCVPKQPTLATSLQFLCGEYQWEKKRVIRISRTTPLKLANQDAKSPMVFTGDCKNADALVIHDATSLWRESVEAGEFLRGFRFDRYGGDLPTALVILEDCIPDLRVDESSKTAMVGGRKSPVWTELLKHTRNVAILCSVSALRRSGAAISRRLSWEQGLEDVLADLRLFKPLQTLSRFGHLFIRVGFIGACHILTEPDQKRFGQVVFAPNVRNAIFCDEAKDGRIRGQDSVIAASLLHVIRLCTLTTGEKTRQMYADKFGGALKSGLTANMRLYDGGFGTTSAIQTGDAFLKSYFCLRTKSDAEPDDVAKLVTTHYDDLLVAKHNIPINRMFGTVGLVELPTVPKTKPWHILRSQIKAQGLSRINLGIAICKFGHQQVLNRPIDDATAKVGPWAIKREALESILTQPECILSANEMPDDQTLGTNVRVALPHPTDFRPTRPTAKPLFVPLLEVGDLVAIERTEIESLRSIQNLMELYVESQGKAPAIGRPFSIAVFGAPGSGKSFAIKQFSKSINAAAGGSDQLEPIEYNVAQFRSVEDLGHAINRIASINNQRKIPLVFFDEFDCSFGDQPLGWLKFFLAPMQDGTFYGASQTISFGRAIFVFAGGLCRTIAEFDPFAEPLGATHPEEMEHQLKRQAAFRDQKGPDFVSRLRGHINILSLNPDENAARGVNGKVFKPILRRALTLRGLILQANRFVKRDGCEVANVDSDVLYAFLTVEHYRHGTRSMEAILQMCTPIDGVIEKASLPSRAQLNMHVDADDFMVRVLRGRFRRFFFLDESEVQSAEIVQSDEQANGGGKNDDAEARLATEAALDAEEPQLPKPTGSTTQQG